MTLCGISSRFQLLFPSEGQVAHALLARPYEEPLVFVQPQIVRTAQKRPLVGKY